MEFSTLAFEFLVALAVSATLVGRGKNAHWVIVGYGSDAELPSLKHKICAMNPFVFAIN